MIDPYILSEPLPRDSSDEPERLNYFEFGDAPRIVSRMRRKTSHGPGTLIRFV